MISPASLFDVFTTMPIHIRTGQKEMPTEKEYRKLQIRSRYGHWHNRPGIEAILELYSHLTCSEALTKSCIDQYSTLLASTSLY